MIKLKLSLALILIIFSADYAAYATTVVTYPKPAKLDASYGSDQYSVTVNGSSSFVYKSNWGSESASFTCFAFSSGSVTVEVTKLQGTFDSVTIRPLRNGIKGTVTGNKVTFTLNQPQKISVEFNGNTTHKLFIFADAPETNVPSPNDPNVIYYAPGVYDIKTLVVPTGKILYVAGGAFLRGKVDGASGSTLQGRGIISGVQYGHNEGCSFITGFSNIDGVTLIEGPGYMMCTDSNATVNNVKVIGWQDNTDGIHGGISIHDCFFFCHDDAIDIGQGSSNKMVTDCVIWNKWGSSLLFSWNTKNNTHDVTVKNVTTIHYDSQDGLSWVAPIMAAHGGSGNINRFLIENFTAEASTNGGKRFISLQVTDNPWASAAATGSIKNLILRNIQVDYPTSNNIIYGKSSQYKIDSVTFENLRIQGQLITSAAQAHLDTNAYATHVRFISSGTSVALGQPKRKSNRMSVKGNIIPIVAPGDHEISGVDLCGKLLVKPALPGRYRSSSKE